MSAIKLSICIPTYNREAFLRNTLTRCLTDYRFDFPYEIVISDNASTDNTEQVAAEFIRQGLPIRYFRRQTNGGSGPNLASAFRHAMGEYTIYLADDDALIADKVASVVNYLDANPDVTACYAPWYLYDEVEDRDTVQFYTVEADTKFRRHSFLELFQFLFKGHIFPEIAIYRSSALRSAWVPRDFCFWAFSYLAHFLDQGAVAFLREPFYRFVTISRIAQHRQHAGHDDVMTAWDRYRGGLEYFLYVGAKRGKISATREARTALDEMCRTFTLARMAVAIRFWAAQKDFIKAYELYTRMALGGMADHPEVARLRESFPLLVAVQTLAWQVNAAAEIDRVILSGVTDARALGDLLRELGLQSSIEITEEPEEHVPERFGRTAVFVPDDTHRDRYVALGYRPNLVFSEADLVQHIVI